MTTSAKSLPSGSIEGAGELTPSVDRFYEALAAIVIPAIEAVLRD